MNLTTPFLQKQDGRHMLIIANNFDANAARYQTQVRTRWHM